MNNEKWLAKKMLKIRTKDSGIFSK